MSGAGRRLASVGISSRAACGVRDYGLQLSRALEAEGVDCSTSWLELREGGLRSQRAAVAGFAASVEAELARERPHAVLLEYSVFSFSFKGVPLWVEPVFAALRRSGAPVVSVLHEFAYPWGYGGPRGVVWALTQRAALAEVVRSSAALIATTEDRVGWLRSRPWLPSRETVLAPVFSNLPAAADGIVAAGGPDARREQPGPAVLGLFGYSHQSASVALTLDAVADLRSRGLEVELRLLGAPGRSSPGGERWVLAAAARGIAEHVSFTGHLPAQELSDAIAACEILLFTDTAGPSSRRTTLAASLATGRAVVAIDGPGRWQAMIDSEALVVVPQAADALAEAIAAMLADETARAAQGARGRAFYAREMQVGRTVAALSGLLDRVVPARA